MSAASAPAALRQRFDSSMSLITASERLQEYDQLARFRVNNAAARERGAEAVMPRQSIPQRPIIAPIIAHRRSLAHA